MYLIKHALVYAQEFLGAENADADLVLADENSLELLTVFAKGVLMISDKKILVKGTFE